MDTKKVSLIANIIKIAIALIGAILCIKIMAGDESDGVISAALNVSYLALILCAGIALLFGLAFFLTHIKSSKGLLFGLVGFAIIAAISYSMADGDLTADWINKGITEKASKLSGMGVYSVFFLLAIAVLTALLGEVTRFFK